MRRSLRVWVILEVIQMLVRAKMGGKSLDRGSVFGAMSQRPRRRKCVEPTTWFAEG